MGFHSDFQWGVATAALQIEGAAKKDGRGLSVWDTFCNEKGSIFDGHHAEIACDHYHRFEQDIKMMSELGVKVYRFSISWTRILPEGIGETNQKGIDFYNRLINLLLKYNITPYMTLFHWDYPFELEKKGGWLNNESPKWFESFTKVAAKAFGDRVKHFITLNEPQCFIGAAYKDGYFAPGRKLENREVVQMSHNVLLAHGLAVGALKEYAPGCKVGYASTANVAIPYTNSKEDIEAARKAYFDVQTDSWTWCVSWWSDPVMLGHYPKETKAYEELSKYLPENYREDMKIISEPIDFYGQNVYKGVFCKSKGSTYEWMPYKTGYARTANYWPITPEALYWATKYLYERYKHPIMITENGISCHDAVSLDGKVHDPNRIDFIQRHLKELKKAADDGTDVLGYMYWSFMDNFEWCEGYRERFGLIYVDYDTLDRIPKDSYDWYKDLILANGENI